MTVEVRWRYALPLLSGLILFMLRHWPWVALAYCIGVLLLGVGYLIWRKKKAPLVAKMFRQALMVHLSESNEKGLSELTKSSMLMSSLGLEGLLYEARAFHCALKHEFDDARNWARRALNEAQLQDRSRLLFNMARWTALSGSNREATTLFRQLDRKSVV